MNKNLFISLLIVTLLSAVSSTYPISSIFLFLAVAFGSLFLVYKLPRIQYVEKFIFIIILYFVYSVLSALISGINLSGLISYSFLRYDGNAFYSMLPLLFFYLIKDHKYNLDQIFQYFIFLVGVIIFLFYEIINIPLFNSHNAMGGVLISVVLVNLFLFMKKKNFIIFALLCLNLYLLMLSDSRGSIIAVVLSIAMYFILNKSKSLFLSLSIIGSGIYLFLLFKGYIYWDSIGKPIELSMMGMDGDDISDFQLFGDASLSRLSTILHRVIYIWPYAIDQFLQNPLFGIGFTRFNDVPCEMYYITDFMGINMSNYIMFNDLHAHNSLLHILAEQGLIGATLFILIYVYIFKKSKSSEYKDLILLLLFAVIVSSLFEHRATTPAQMIPINILIVLIITKIRRNNEKSINS